MGTDPADARLRDLLSRPLPDDVEHAEALALLRAHASINEAREVAQEWAAHARGLLAPLPDIPARQVLEALCDYVVSRTG
jgi:heptaprenyl diphosphate synthase